MGGNGELWETAAMTLSPVAITLIGFIGSNLALVGFFIANRAVAQLSKVDA